MNNNVKKVLVSQEQITERAKQLGKQISEDYKDKYPILVALLKGSIPFMAELMKYIDIDMETEFMDVSSYAGTQSTGEVKIIKDLDRSIKDCDVIIVEDIVDTGRTLKTVSELLYSKGAKSVKIVTLLNKEARRVADIKADYIGFEIPDEFVIGFGLDYDEKYRNLPFVGVLKEECYKE